MSEKDLDIAIEKCERIMEFDTRTLENPESENGWLFEKVYDLLEFLRQFQFVEQMPSAQPSVSKTEIIGDTISRQAAINVVRTAKDKSEAHRMLIQLPSAQPGWIPTSVRLPEEKTGVLITTTKGYVIQCMYWGYQNGHHTWRSLGGEHLYWEMDVLAWCELPTPYREGGQE